MFPVPPQVIDSASNHLNRVNGGMQGTTVPHFFALDTVSLVAEHDHGEVSRINDGVRHIPVAFEAPLTLE